MPRARKKKKTSFDPHPVRCAFLHGKPNQGKLKLLKQMEQENVRLINQDIAFLADREDIALQLIKNDKKDPYVRTLEKALRQDGFNSAFCQNAFDTAFAKLSNRLNAIRIDMYQEMPGIFTQSKVLFAMGVMHRSKDDMEQMMYDIASHTKRNSDHYLDIAGELAAMSVSAFSDAMLMFNDLYVQECIQFKVPVVKHEQVMLDTRLMKLSRADHTQTTHVIRITDPFHKAHRFDIPINASRYALRKLEEEKAASSVSFRTTKRGLIRVQIAYQHTISQPATNSLCGVDTGMTDCFFLSDGRSIGSMKDVIAFYKQTVEPAFAELSHLREKKAHILHYVRTHQLKADVRKNLLAKVDRLEHMIKTANAPYRKKRHYYALLNQKVSQCVTQYVDHTPSNVLTVLERLDIKTFRKSHKVNGSLSVFARGLLQKKLMSELNIAGRDFIEVEPDFTSQLCPVCGHVSEANRHGKDFTCTCCGHHDDADHNAAVNIKQRAEDTEILDICSNVKGHSKIQKAMLITYAKRNQTWAAAHQQEACA